VLTNHADSRRAMGTGSSSRMLFIPARLWSAEYNLVDGASPESVVSFLALYFSFLGGEWKSSMEVSSSRGLIACASQWVYYASAAWSCVPSGTRDEGTRNCLELCLGRKARLLQPVGMPCGL